MKSWSVVFCVAAVAATASACGSGTQDSGGASGATTDGNVTLTLTAITDAKPAWEELFAQYKKVEPNVTFKASFLTPEEVDRNLVPWTKVFNEYFR